MLTPETVEERLRSMTILVAESDAGEIAGTLAWCLSSDGEGHFRGMAVLPHWQGSGVAGTLITTAEASLRQLGCLVITLDTTRPLVRAQRFYAKHGFVQSGKVTDFYGMPLFEHAKVLG